MQKLNSINGDGAYSDARKVVQTIRKPGNVVAGGAIRVMCVEDHTLLVEGLRSQFSIDDQIRIVCEISSADTLLDEVAKILPDIVMFDIELPGKDVFEMADRMRRIYPNVRFFFLSAHIRDGYLASAYNCGAWGYFAKSDRLEDIVAGIREIAHSKAGAFCMGPKVREHCRPSVSARTDATSGDIPGRTDFATPLSTLTDRELEVLRLIGKGLSRTQIASQLNRSPKTIDGHQERMMTKLKVSTRTELVRMAIREGLAEV